MAAELFAGQFVYIVTTLRYKPPMIECEMNALVIAQTVGQKIFLIRGQRIMLDSDLAKIYGVTTARLRPQRSA